MSAAISAARMGKRVYLLEAKPRPGGTVTHALIHTLGSFYNSSGEFVNQGIAEELVSRLTAADDSVGLRRMGRLSVLSVCPKVYLRVVQEWLDSTPNLTVLYGTTLSAARTADGRVIEIEAVHQGQTFRLRPSAVVDATGTAELVRRIDPKLAHDRDTPAAGGLVFSVRNVEHNALAFPKGMRYLRAIHRAAGDGLLPQSCSKAWLDRGVRDDEIYVKLFIPAVRQWRSEQAGQRFEREAANLRDSVWELLSKWPEFARAEIDLVGELGIREGGQIVGEYTLTAEDVRQERKFDDAACRCNWPIEYWDPSDGVSVEYLSDDGYYEIPLRALKLKNFENVWAAGKCLSAEPLAQASARVVGTCWSMGEAAGRQAATYRGEELCLST